MDAEIERRVRERAYAIWEQEGRLHGNDREHWERAKRLIAEELLCRAAAAPARVSAPAPAATSDAGEVPFVVEYADGATVLFKIDAQLLRLGDQVARTIAGNRQRSGGLPPGEIASVTRATF